MKKNSALFSVLQGNPAVASPKEQLYEQLTSNSALTERNIQKPNAYLLNSRPEQKYLVTYHTLPSFYVCVWLLNTLTSTAPIGSPIICMWSPADICEQWERNLSFISADVRGAGTRDEPLRTSAWEATFKGDDRGLKLKLCSLKSPKHFMVNAPWRSAFDTFLMTLYQHFVHG